MSIERRWGFALRWASCHLLASALVASITAAIVFLGWYPPPYQGVLGITDIYLVIVVADVICGPILTLVVASPSKSRRELFLDVSLIGLIQIAVLCYGLYVAGVARPVLVVFERDRFVVVRASEVDHSQLNDAPPELRKLSWFGPKMATTRSARDVQELLGGIELSLQGLGPGHRPGWWKPYEQDIPEVLRRANPVAILIERKSPSIEVITNAVKKTAIPINSLRYLPLVAGKSMGWTALINSEGQIVGSIPVDGFVD